MFKDPGGVCLVMIVRNEAHCLRRCLTSVRPHITQWCIVDTGSDDETPDIAMHMMRDMHGVLAFRPWVDFGHNRTEAFELAPPSPWYLVIDADETLHGALTPQWLPRQGHSLMVTNHGKEFPRAALLPYGVPWRWDGAIDEQISPNLKGLHVHQDAWIVSHADGGRHKVEGWAERDLEIMRAQYESSKNPRDLFHLACRLEGLGKMREAMEAYLTRAQINHGWQDEQIVSIRKAGAIARMLGLDTLARACESLPEACKPSLLKV